MKQALVLLLLSRCTALAQPAPVLADDLPQLTINDVVTSEGQLGSSIQAVFTVTLSGVVTGRVDVDWSTQDLTTTAGTDYRVSSGHLVFNGPGTRQVSITIFPDHLIEGDEVFFVNLSSATGAMIADGTGHGAIRDDDFVSPRAKCDLDHNGRSNLLVSFEHIPNEGSERHTPVHQDVGVTGTIPANSTNSVEYRAGTDPDWLLLAMDDFNGDHNCDLLWALHDTMAITLGGADGHLDAPWNEDQILPVTHPGEDWVLVGSGSFDQDARADVVWWNTIDRTLRAWLWSGDVFVAHEVTGIAADRATWDPMAIVHLSGEEGASGIVWRQPVSGALKYWQMNGLIVETTPPLPNPWDLEGDLPKRIAAVGDFNGDGHDDLVWQHGTEDGSIWFMQGNECIARSVLSTGQVLFPGHTPGYVTGPR